MKGPLETCDEAAARAAKEKADFAEFMWMAEEGGVDAFDKKCEEEFMSDDFMDIYLQQMLEEEEEAEAQQAAQQPQVPNGQGAGDWWYPPQQQQPQQPRQPVIPQQMPHVAQPAPEVVDPAVLLACRMQGMQVAPPDSAPAPPQVPAGSSKLNPNAAVFVPRFLQATADDR